jgi:predicted DNA-binding transcriptional regulator AlpA
MQTKAPVQETVNIDPLLAVREGAAFLQISVPTFWRRVADGTIPKPVKLGGLSRWPQSEILAVIETAKAARTAI